MRSFLLCTDLDRTLMPNGAAPESPGARRLFARLAALEESVIAYVTGRHRQLILEAMRQFDLPPPDFAISDVGSTIYEVAGGEWRQWRAWDDEIASDWHGRESAQLAPLLGGLPELKLQEAEKQNRHKLSYYLPLAAARSAIMEELRQRLDAAGMRANLIWSIDEAAGTGLLDILPASANKRHAIEFLMREQGFDFGNTVFAGDSGNDLDVVMSPVHSVLVANADRELLGTVESSAADGVYVARGGFLGMNGNYSAGILEGVAHYLPEVGQWLRQTA